MHYLLFESELRALLEPGENQMMKKLYNIEIFDLVNLDRFMVLFFEAKCQYQGNQKKSSSVEQHKSSYHDEFVNSTLPIGGSYNILSSIRNKILSVINDFIDEENEVDEKFLWNYSHLFSPKPVITDTFKHTGD